MPDAAEHERTGIAGLVAYCVAAVFVGLAVIAVAHWRSAPPSDDGAGDASPGGVDIAEADVVVPHEPELEPEVEPEPRPEPEPGVVPEPESDPAPEPEPEPEETSRFPRVVPIGEVGILDDGAGETVWLATTLDDRGALMDAISDANRGGPGSKALFSRLVGAGRIDVFPAGLEVRVADARFGWQRVHSVEPSDDFPRPGDGGWVPTEHVRPKD